MFKNTILLSVPIFISILLVGQNPLAIPEALSGTDFDLNINQSSKSFFPGFQTNTIGINNDYLGPTLILNKGDFVTLNVQNNLDETTTIHWHGMHVSAKNDGGPHTTIPNGTTWSPSFEVMDKAATYWYHSHLHEKTAEHVTKGAAGVIIVRDDEEAVLNLPREYGVDDFPVVIQSRAFDASKQFIVESAQDDLMLVNGTINPYLEIPAQVVRLRLLNGSTERVYNLGFEGNQSFYQIASDGGCLSSPVALTRLHLAPGERAEILLNLNGMNGESFYLKSFASELPNGIYGASNPSVMPMGSISGYASNNLNGNDFNILRLDVIQSTANAITNVPSSLVEVTPLLESASDITRNFNFQPQQMGPSGMVNGPFVINGQSFDMDIINVTIPLNNTEIWQLTNNTAIAHPFHIHDVQFNILDIDGTPPPANMQGWKDVVLVPALQTVRFITKFEDFSDPDVPYMYHCHMLTHEDAGMMGQFLVIGNPTSTKNFENNNPSILIYPNPTEDYLNISLLGKNSLIKSISIFDFTGKIIIEKSDLGHSELNLDISNLPVGSYFLKIKTNNGVSVERFLVNR